LLNPSGEDGGKPAPAQKRWADLRQNLLLEQGGALDAIAAEPGYAHLKGNTEALALEWFARQAEARPELLTRPSLVMQMWDNFKDSVKDLMARLGLDPLEGRDLDAQVMDLLKRARRSAVQGGSGPM